MQNELVFEKTAYVAEQTYLLFELMQKSKGNRNFYSIRATLEGDSANESVTVEDVCSDTIFAFHVFDKIVSCSVRPCHLKDVIYDMLCEDEFVTKKERTESRRDRETTTCGS